MSRAHRPLALLLGTFLGVAGLIAVLAAPAIAETGDLADIKSADSTLKFVLRAQGLPTTASVVPDSVQVTLDGDSVEPEARPFDPTITETERVSLLTIDTSGSMRGQRLQAAKDAANAYLQAVPPDVLVGLAEFNDSFQVVVPPTTDREQVSAAVSGLQVGGKYTGLYDAVIQSMDVLGTEGLRSLVLLSDGANDSPLPTTLEDAVARVTGAQAGDGAGLTIVSIEATPELRNSLTALADASGARGELVETAGLDEVAAHFQEAGNAIAQQVEVTVPVPENLLGKTVSISVNALANDGTRIDAEGSFLVPAPPVPSEPAPDYGPKPVAAPSSLIGQEILPVALVAMFVGLATIIGIALLTTVQTDGRAGRISRRLSFYSLAGRLPQKQSESTTTTVLGSSAIARSAVELAGRVVSQRRIEPALVSRLDSAGLLLKPGEWTLIHLGAGVFGALLFLLLSGGGVIATVLGLALGLIVPQVYLVFRRSRRENAFLSQLPETLQLMAGSLSVGYSLSQAVDTVVREGTQPMSTEFNRAMVRTRLGVPVEDALETVAQRVDSKDMSWAVMAIRIQREVGGNLAEVLTNVAGTLRERERLNRQVRVLSAEGRLSAWILSLLPIAFTLYIALVRPEYLRPLYTTSLGWVFLILGIVLLVVGVFWLRKVVKVEV